MMKYRVTTIIGFILLAFSIKASAEVLQAPLILKYNLSGPVTVESDAIKTSGTIKAIACSWESVGKATIEVSANKGVAYTKIINGQILNEGFIPGNELRLKAIIPQNSILKKVVLGYSDSSGVSRMPENARLADYKYHKKIRISESPEELFNYPLMVRIDKKDLAGAQKDYRDVCFVSADGATELDYYFENSVIASPEGAKQSRNDIATFWVKVPQIPKDEALTLYLYYGNQGQGVSPQGTSPLTKVFAFFDDFSGASFNEEKWQKNLGLKSECRLKDGYLELRDATILSRTFKMKEGVLEFKARAEANAAIQGIIQQAFESGIASLQGQGVSPQGTSPLTFKEVFYSSAYPGAEHTIAINDVAKLNIGKPIEAQTDYIYKVSVNASGVVFERYSQDYEKQVQLKFLDAGLSGAGFIGLKTDASFLGDGLVYFDWVRVRPYVEFEPKVEVQNED